MYKHVVRDAKSYPVFEEWTDKKVKRTCYIPDQDVQVDSMKAGVPELKNLRVSHIEEKKHNLRCLPVVEMRNKQKLTLWVDESLKLKTTTCHMVSGKRNN